MDMTLTQIPQRGINFKEISMDYKKIDSLRTITVCHMIDGLDVLRKLRFLAKEKNVGDIRRACKEFEDYTKKLIANAQCLVECTKLEDK